MNNLRELRKSKRLTQAELANFIGISQNNYSYWENEKVKIDNQSLQKLADYFNVSVDYLLGREEKEKPTSNDVSFETFREVLQEKGLSDLEFKSLSKEQLSAIAEIIKNFKK